MQPLFSSSSSSSIWLLFRRAFYLTATLSITALLSVVEPANCAPSNGPGSEEQSAIQTLTSSAPPQEKDAACAKLKRIGTAASIPALAALLTDEQLSHSARYALEPMSNPKAGDALIAALDETSGGIRIGIIDSVAVRHEKGAVSKLVKLLNDRDVATGCAAATALAQIDTARAVRALTSALKTKTPRLHQAVVGACLTSAGKMTEAHQYGNARSIYKQLLKDEREAHVRMAAFAGLVRCSGSHALSVEITAIRGNDDTLRAAALRLVPELKVPKTDEDLARLLPKVNPVTQIALLQGLGFREATNAAPAIASLLASPDPSVRIAAANALGSAGTEHEVAVLLEIAATAKSDEQTAARNSLRDLRHGPVNAALIAELERATPELQAEAARTLGARGAKDSVPTLFALARNSSDSVRKAAFRAMPELIEPGQLPPLVKLVVTTPAGARDEATECLTLTCDSVKRRKGKLDTAPIVAYLQNGSKESTLALLPVCSGLADETIRTAERNAAGSSDPEIHSAAVLAICDSVDPELLPDIAQIAATDKDAATKERATRACVRLTTEEDSTKVSNAKRAKAYETILGAAPSTVQKKMLLAGLGEIPDIKAFKLIVPLLDQADVRLEAQQAAIKTGARISGTVTQEVIPALEKICQAPAEDELLAAAKRTISELKSASDYITTWQLSGPYTRKGKNFAELFDISFPPEKLTAKPVWKNLTSDSTSHDPRVIDLLHALGGNNCVGYARAVIYSAEEQPARFDFGSDDGIKVWFNNKVVLSNNVARGLQIGSDHADVVLKKGANRLLLKISQNVKGWEFTARLTKPDGSHLDDVHWSTTEETHAVSAK